MEDNTFLGSDVGVGHLKQAITNIEPLATGQLQVSDVGKKFIALGYGVQESRLTFGAGAGAASLPPPKSGTRRAGEMTLRAIDGGYLKIIYPDFDHFVMVRADGDLSRVNDPDYRKV